MKVADLLIVGAGAAGLLAAYQASQRKSQVLLLEKNRKVGVKILMSGGTRCNLTHDTDQQGILSAFEKKQARFLKQALYHFSPDDLLSFFHERGLPTKVELTGKVFPQSDSAVDVQRTLLEAVKTSGAKLLTEAPVTQIERVDQHFQISTDQRLFQAKKVLITSGGRSYPGCGTTGDGYQFAQSLGHEIVPTAPALAPLVCTADWLTELSGITLTDVQLTLLPAEQAVNYPHPRKSILRVERGSTLITHFGLSGPAPMNLSKFVTAVQQPNRLVISLDLCPEVSLEELRSCWNQLQGKWQLRKGLQELLPVTIPRKWLEMLLSKAEVNSEVKVAEVTRQERERLLKHLKGLLIPVHSARGFAKAEVTSGGVSLSEVNPRTMESRIQPGLYFAGEVLDIDGPIGGYNFQTAFSTGVLAADHL